MAQTSIRKPADVTSIGMNKPDPWGGQKEPRACGFYRCYEILQAINLPAPPVRRP